jgi:hypothetical protein
VAKTSRLTPNAGVSAPYLPSHLMGGNVTGSPAAGFPSPIGKSRSIQNLGNYIGQRAAGLTRGLRGPNQELAHAFDNYGKPKESGLKGL